MLGCGISSPSFHLIHHPEQRPYLVISPLVQVDDTREPLLNPDDGRISEWWMTNVVGCVLGNIVAKSQGVRIDSLGVIVCGLNPRAFCKLTVWLVK